MNRRRFLQAILGTPLLTPLLISSQEATHNCELYLISDQPQSHLWPLLEELQDSCVPRQKTFSFLNSHPCQDDMSRLLMQMGWAPAVLPTHSGLRISFSHLLRKTRPSFSLVKNGKIWDIRTQRLNSLWQSMGRAGSLTSLLAAVTFSSKPSSDKDGLFVSLFKDGAQIEHLPHEGSWTRSIPTKHGPLTIRMNEGQTWIAESSCRHKICVSTPPVSKPGERIICAPNHFLLEIQGRRVDTVIG